MLNSGPTGFYNAPVSKALLLGTGAFSVVVHIAKLNKHLSLSLWADILENRGFHRFYTNQLYFDSASELLVGLLLLYGSRMFERRWGSRKFASFALLTFALSPIAQLPLMFAVRPDVRITPGPLPLIFACVVQWIYTVPSTWHFRIFGLNIPNKIFMLLMSSQLMLRGFPSSAVSATSGALFGLAYMSSSFSFLRRIRIPVSVSNLAARLVLPFLRSAPPRPNQTNTRLGGNGTGANANANTDAHTHTHAHGHAHTHAHAHTPIAQPAPILATPDPALVQQLVAMGFGEAESRNALARSGNDVLAASNLLLDQ